MKGPAGALVLLLALTEWTVSALKYNATLDPWNINKNQEAEQIIDYSTPRRDSYTPSPENWRSKPCYTLLLDKWMNGHPENDDYFKTLFEYDWRETQMRAGGDAFGMAADRSLDYLEAMGYKCVYIAGTPFLNMPWQADGYSALDFSLLDPHYGTMDDWIYLIDRMHEKGIYIIMDFTVGTMGDMIGFSGHLNSSTPWRIEEYEVEWKRPPYAPWGFDHYPDFSYSNEYNYSCQYPTFYLENGDIWDVGKVGCYASDFDQYGDIEAFGVFPDWQRQLAKFASVQDRLREWQPAVSQKIKMFGCMAIEAFDIDGIRIDKATQVTVDFMADWSQHTRACARDNFGKNNFFIPGEITGGDTFGALYVGRGRLPAMRPGSPADALTVNTTSAGRFIRNEEFSGLDSAAFHYSIYRNIARFLGQDGNLNVAYDIPVGFIDAWQYMMESNDFINVMTNKFDPRHQYGTTNQDVFRWPGIVNGTQKQQLGQFICNLLLPGQPLLWYGEEQGMYVLDNGAANYLYGRQSMVSNQAWQRHACYKLGSEQYYNMHWDKALSGCDDDWNSLDHFDPTAEPARGIRNQLWLRTQYPALQDGFDLEKFGNWTSWIQLPGSNGTGTEIGMWGAYRAPYKYQTEPENNEWGFTPAANSSAADGTTLDRVFLLYTNENYTRTHQYDCGDENMRIEIPFAFTGSGSTIKNLVYPYEELAVTVTNKPFYNDGNSPYFGCLPSIDMQPYDYKVFVQTERWRPQPPSITRFSPGHDARIERNGDTIDIQVEFDQEMNCASMNGAISIANFQGASGVTAPSLQTGTCAPIPANERPIPGITGAGPSAWRYTSQITGAQDGIYDIRITNVDMEGQAGVNSNATHHLLLRVGQSNNPMVFPKTADYSDTLLSTSDGKYTLNNSAPGAQYLRYSGNFGQVWSDWVPYQQSLEMDDLTFKNNWWKGSHVIVQYYSNVTLSSQHIQHGDADYTGVRRRYPQLLARGLFNNWGYDLGAFASFVNKEDDVWRMPLSASWPSFIQLNVWDYDDYFYGDQDGDGIIDRLPPNALSPNFMNMSEPPAPFLSWEITINDLTGQWSVEPIGAEVVTIVGFALLVVIPILTAFIAAAIFRYSFYSIKVNKWGLKPNKSEKSYFPILGGGGEKKEKMDEKAVVSTSKKPERIIGWPENPSKRRKVLIATLEYEIIDWKLKVKIGGLGVMSTLMGKAMTDVDLIWVVPKVQDIDYPQGDYAEPIEVTIFGEPYLIEVETHQLDNITYIILDSPVFRAQTKSDPYPQRMDDLSSAIFYSTWNQAIAETVRRFPDIDIYHINDYHGALAPLYLLPKVLPVCLSLHNAEFQGLWPLRTKEEMKEVCAAFNISKDVCSKYVQFGNTFNLLHAAASFISIHQKSVGVAGVSDKYGKRSWARYPALWTLRNIDSLPNPDPTDIAALDEQPLAVGKIQVDTEAESKRPEQKRQAQEWAGIKQDPNADLFVFVGRWSKQKGVDLIADVMPALLDKKPKIQLICVGPVIDLYGRFAAEKLARLMEMYPDRVFSKPEFTALPPYLFSGADFALIPSRDEPFGLVAVEFGRKGALGVGSRLGGLGLMPGWWFPVESSATKHMLSQLTKTIRLALKSTEEERAILRARSAVQRFPVVEWRQRLEDFQRRSIGTSRTNAGENAWGADMAGLGVPGFYAHDAGSNASLARPGSPDSMMSNRRSSVPQMPPQMAVDQPMANDNLSPGASYHDRFKRNQNRQSAESFYDEDPNAEPLYYGDKRRSKKFFAGGYNDDASSINSSDQGGESSSASMNYNPNNRGGAGGQGYDSFLAAANKQFAKTSGGRNAPDPYFDPRASGTGENFMPSRPFSIHSRVSSFDSISSIVDEKNASPLNKQLDSFTDSDGEVAQNFVQKLRDLSAGNSMNEMCIEKFLMKSEKQFFSEIKKEKMAQAPSLRSRDSFIQSHSPSMMDGYRPEYERQQSVTAPYQHSYSGHGHDDHGFGGEYDEAPMEKPLTRLEVFMQRTVFGWPLYTIIIAMGQLLSATSFQLSLLGGSNTLKEVDLYIVCSVFVVSTVAWYTIFRMLPSVWVLSLPWLAFGCAFALIGFPSIGGIFLGPRLVVTRVATWTYAVASAAGFLQFGLNFGEEAGAATEVWIMRACIVQGLQQIWVSALWYWGYTLNGQDPTTYVPPRAIAYVVFPLAAMSFAFAGLLFKGLPEYYRQIPPYVPNFFKTLLRRKLVLWFWVSEILRSYWLSGPYGRNWQFLWSAIGIPLWSIVVMIIIFFIGIWGLLMGILIKYAKVHSWLLPVFAVGLGAPRWCQMWWGTSGMGLYLPWAGVAGPYVSTCLWLWLGVLDALQGVGLGMILLQTLSRLHVCATLAAAQLIGSCVVMIARATSPSKVGPGNVFPNPAIWNPSTGENNPFAHWEFWLALACQIVIVFGYFFFFRKEQLSKP